VKLVYLVGFITNKFVTMLGHMNVKNHNVCILQLASWWWNFIVRNMRKFC